MGVEFFLNKIEKGRHDWLGNTLRINIGKRNLQVKMEGVDEARVAKKDLKSGNWRNSYLKKMHLDQNQKPG